MGITNFSFSLVYRYSNDFNLNLEGSKGAGLGRERGQLYFLVETAKNQRHIYLVI